MTGEWQDRYVAHAWVERDGAVLLLRRCAGRYLGGQWDIPGGTVEPGETPARAAVRETYEEAGLRVAPSGELTRYHNRDTGGRPLLFHTVTFRVTEPPGPPAPVVLDPVEHDRYVWLPPERALEIDLVRHVQRTVEWVRAVRAS